MELKKEKKLCEVKTSLTEEDYIKINSFIKFHKSLFIITLFEIIIAILIMLLIHSLNQEISIKQLSVSFITVIIFIYILQKKSKKYITREYNYLLKKGKINKISKIIFYNDYFEQISSTFELKEEYTNIIKNIETKDAFYIICKSTYIIIEKTNLKDNEIEFIRNLNKDHYIDDKKIEVEEKNKTEEKSDKNHEVNYKGELNNYDKKLKLFSAILFYITLVSFPIAKYIRVVMSKNVPTVLSFSYGWICYFFIPIPFLSLIFGIRTRNKNVRCTKNKIIGVIGVVYYIMIAISATQFNSLSKKDYQDAKPLEKILNAKLPESGTYYKVEWTKSGLQNENTSFLLFNEDEFSTFHDSVKKNKNWLKIQQIDKKLKEYIPYMIRCEQAEQFCYYSLYFEINDEYNVIPEQKENYTVYVMMYNVKKSYIQVESYMYVEKDKKIQ